MPTKLHNTKCIIQNSIFRRRGNFVGVKPKTLRVVAPFGLLFVLFNIANVNLTNALSVTVDGSISATKTFELIPGSSGASGEVAISVVSSDVAGGYTLSMTGPNAAKTLVGTNNNSNILGPIAGSTWTTPASFGDDTWGVLPSRLCTGETADTCADNTFYQPAPGDTNQIIDVTTSAGAAATTYALAFGAKVSDTKTPDTYTGTITMMLTANATPYTIGFVDKTANMPNTLSGETAAGSVTIPTDIPTKPGYAFAGWCLDEIATIGATCPAEKTYQPGQSYPISSTTAKRDLYAIWVESIDAPQVTQLDHDTLSFSSSDGVAYYVSTSSTQPSASDSGWTTATTYDIPQPEDGEESYTYYVFAKNSGGTVSLASAPTIAYRVTAIMPYGLNPDRSHIKVGSEDGETIIGSFTKNVLQTFYVFENTSLYVYVSSECNATLKWNGTQVASYSYITSYIGAVTGVTHLELGGSNVFCV